MQKTMTHNKTPRKRDQGPYRYHRGTEQTAYKPAHKFIADLLLLLLMNRTYHPTMYPNIKEPKYENQT